MPESVAESELYVLLDELKGAVAGVPELELHKAAVTVFFPCDRVQDGLGEEVICFVEGLFDTPERTSTVRRKLAQRLYATLLAFTRDHMPNCAMIEVFVSRFDPDKEGFASGSPLAAQ